MDALVPANPDYVAAVRRGFANQPLMGFLGATIDRIEPGSVEIRVPFRTEISQNHGYFHGGVIGAIADVAGGFAAYSLVPAGGSVLSAEYKVNIVAPGLGDELIGRGQVIRGGKTLIFTEARLFVVHKGEENLCAVMLQTIRAHAGGGKNSF